MAIGDDLLRRAKGYDRRAMEELLADVYPVVYRMAHTGVTAVLVLDRDTNEPVGLMTLADLLQGRRLTLEAEHRRERVFTIPFIFRPGVM